MVGLVTMPEATYSRSKRAEIIRDTSGLSVVSFTRYYFVLPVEEAIYTESGGLGYFKLSHSIL